MAAISIGRRSEYTIIIIIKFIETIHKNKYKLTKIFIHEIIY